VQIDLVAAHDGFLDITLSAIRKPAPSRRAGRPPRFLPTRIFPVDSNGELLTMDASRTR